jgi:nucleoside-diphosphate-sugar epimerase
MKIFLTGGTGFLGSHFLRLAIDADLEVVALRSPGKKCRLPLASEPLWIDGTLEEYPSSALEDVDVLVHLAAHGVNPVNSNWIDCFRCNVTASLGLWLAASEAGVRRYVIAGSCFEYGKSGENIDFIPTDAPLLPTGPYHSSKAAATMAALGFAVDHQREVVVLRPFHIYGEGESPERFWPSLVKAAKEGEDFPMSEGLQVRDFVSAEQVASCFLESTFRQDLVPGKPMIENVGSGEPKTLIQFAKDEWMSFGAIGKLLPGIVPTRKNEIMRYVPLLKKS